MIVNSMHWKYFFTPILKCFLVQIKEKLYVIKLFVDNYTI